MHEARAGRWKRPAAPWLRRRASDTERHVCVPRTRDANRRSATSCMRTGRAGRRRYADAPHAACRVRPRFARCAQA
ncbi:hypothetical protein CFB50_26260 [Burkholderia sp. AU33423]|nr:hypothetical protein CFB50_26260 [Burkholderia sp. AU33423]